MAQGGYTVKDLYQGGTSSFSPTYGENFTGYQVPAGKLGLSQNPSTANQLAELDKNLKQGVKSTEVGALDPSVFETIPKDHFKEIRRTAKLAGAKPTMHAPVQGMEPSGIDPQQGWSEMQRKQIEDQLKVVAEKAHEMDDRGNMPITIHASNVPGTEWEKDPETGKPKKHKMFAIDQSSGQLVPLKEEKKYSTAVSPTEKGEVGKERDWTPDQKLNNQNLTYWQDSIDQTFFNKERADEILNANYPQIQQAMETIRKNIDKIDPRTEEKDIERILEVTPQQKEAWRKYKAVNTYLQDIDRKIDNLLDEGFKYSDNEKQKEEFKRLNEEYKRRLKDAEKESPVKRAQELENLMTEMKNVVRDPEIGPPKKFKSVEDFQKEKSKETFANVALHAYDKYGDKAPVVSIENVFPGQFGLTRGKDMNELIQASREEFVNKATKPKNQGGLGLNKSQAKKKAEKLIGMTFDVGHLNIQKKFGFTDDDLKKEFQEMAKNKNLKHLHLTDNFGHYDSHLSPGMGNVPFKQYYKEMEKKGYKPKEIDQIVEAGGVINQFGVSPHPYNVENFGSPIYESDQMPYWNQAQGLQQGYMSGYGEVLPQGHFQQFGGGFSQLPAELGGSAGGGGGGSRVSGNPME